MTEETEKDAEYPAERLWLRPVIDWARANPSGDAKEFREFLNNFYGKVEQLLRNVEACELKALELIEQHAPAEEIHNALRACAVRYETEIRALKPTP